MGHRSRKLTLSIVAVASLALPGLAVASGGTDDPPGHVTREHHRSGHERRRGHDDIPGIDQGRAHDGRDNDDGPNHT